MKRTARPREALIFVILSVCFLMILDGFVLKEWQSFFSEKEKQIVVHSEITDYTSATKLENQPNIIYRSDEDETGNMALPQPEPIINKFASIKEKIPGKKVTKVTPPAVRNFKEAKIVIIIDDMGLSHYDDQVIALPGPITLSYLPYGNNLPAKTKKAKDKGHQLMVHMPMEPMNAGLDPGPDYLSTAMDKAVFKKALEEDLEAFDGYVGINNHMGSKLTQDAQAMIWVMEELQKRKLLFVDSKTIDTSLAGQMANSFNLSYGERDVFLDHYPDLESVRKSLKQLENVAYSRGYAIAIGHPKKETIQALKEWLPTLENKDLTLVPVSEVVRHPSRVLTTHQHGPPSPRISQLLE